MLYFITSINDFYTCYTNEGKIRRIKPELIIIFLLTLLPYRQRYFVYRKTIQYIVNSMHFYFIDRLLPLVVELFDIVNTLIKNIQV